LNRRRLTPEEKEHIVKRALQLRKTYRLSSTVVATRLGVYDRSMLRKIMQKYNAWEKFRDYEFDDEE